MRDKYQSEKIQPISSDVSENSSQKYHYSCSCTDGGLICVRKLVTDTHVIVQIFIGQKGDLHVNLQIPQVNQRCETRSI